VGNVIIIPAPIPLLVLNPSKCKIHRFISIHNLLAFKFSNCAENSVRCQFNYLK